MMRFQRNTAWWLGAAITALALVGCAESVTRPEWVAIAPATDAAVVDKPAEMPVVDYPVGTIGYSIQGRPIEAVTLGGNGRRILIIGGIHGNEPEGGRTISAMIAYLGVLEPDAAVRVVRDINPDGTAARTRTNARGIDLNRNWPARNFRGGGVRGAASLSEPETVALHAEIERFGPGLVLVCHAAGRGPFVNFDGPAAPQARAFAEAAAASDSRWRVVADMGYPTPGSLGSYVGVDMGIPILTIEFGRGHDPGAAWLAMRDGVSALLGGGRFSK
jgi:protein MpaA